MDAGFLLAAARLKAIRRRGWAEKAGIAGAESVADHSYMVALASVLVADERGLDAARAARMALLHDVAESVTGDVIPGEMDPADKARAEDEAMSGILAGLPGGARSKLEGAWKEYAEGATEEARLVRQIDKLEMGMQAAAYLRAGHPPGGLAEISESARRGVEDPGLAGLLAGIEGGR